MEMFILKSKTRIKTFQEVFLSSVEWQDGLGTLLQDKFAEDDRNFARLC